MTGGRLVRRGRSLQTVDDAMNQPGGKFPNHPEGQGDRDVGGDAAPTGPSAAGQIAQISAAPVNSGPSPVGHAPFEGDRNRVIAQHGAVRGGGRRRALGRGCRVLGDHHEYGGCEIDQQNGDGVPPRSDQAAFRQWRSSGRVQRNLTANDGRCYNLLRGAAGDYFDQPLSGRPSTSQSSENSALVVVIIARREGSSARPTMLLPLSTISASALGVMRTMPRLPASEPATYTFPARSNANPCGRPRPRKNVLTSPAGLMRYTRSKLEVVGPVTYNSSAGLNAR